jgi:hypothetical protein
MIYRQSVRLSAKPFDVHEEGFFLQLKPCGYSLYVTSSLRRRLVCRLQLLLIVASGVILAAESRGAHDHILLSQI